MWRKLKRGCPQIWVISRKGSSAPPEKEGARQCAPCIIRKPKKKPSMVEGSEADGDQTLCAPEGAQTCAV